jgi:NTE family protein
MAGLVPATHEHEADKVSMGPRDKPEDDGIGRDESRNLARWPRLARQARFRPVVSLPHHVEDTALARLFLGSRRSQEAAWFSLPGGRVLFHAGEEADRLYFVLAGRLGVVQRAEGQEPQFLGVIRPGEPAGEMAMVAGTPHTATVVALRDSELMAMPRAAFLQAIQRDPAIMAELAHLMILRARRAGGGSAGEPAVFGFIGLSQGVKVRELVDRLEAAIAALGYTVAAAGAEVQSAPTEWFSNLEERHDIVLYAAEHQEVGWKAIVGRQVDRLFCVGLGDQSPPSAPQTFAAPPLIEQRLVDLVLIQPAGRKSPSRTEPWIDAAKASRHFHLRKNDDADLDRLARTLTGQSVGLVLSGGGARAYAHIGAIKALHETKTPIDFLGGTSMGAIIAAGVAMGWSDEELDWRIRKAFVDSSPLDDIAFPIIAMTRGDKVRERLAEHFGEALIPDLWLPFFCVSTDLTAGAYHLHKRGMLREALRASIALPGILPPVSQGGHVLVDGAVTKNFPTDIMRSVHLGPIVGVDVAEARGITAEDVEAPVSSWRWLASGEWRKGPPIVSVLMRSATISTAHEQAAARAYTDVLISPDIGPVEIRDWKAYDPAVEAGYRAMMDALSKLGKPVAELRRRRTMAERRASDALMSVQRG